MKPNDVVTAGLGALANNMEEWSNKVREAYARLPETLKGHRPHVIFESMAVDNILLRDMVAKQPKAKKVGEDVAELLRYGTKQNFQILKDDLNAYYLERRDAGEFEHQRLDKYKKLPMPPIFILSYGRYERNSTLELLQKWDDKEVFENTLVFVDPEQEALYNKGFPKWKTYARKANSVGERFQFVLEYCQEHNIEDCLILEDELETIGYLKKGGIDYNSKCNRVDEAYNATCLKYWFYKSREIMKIDPDSVLIGMRNRACSHAEVSIAIGYQYAMRGGAPNICFYVNVPRLLPIWKTIPSSHWSPQYDWALQCAIVRTKKHWHLITAVIKMEKTGTKSVIGYTGDRIKLAREYLKYYGVEDKFRISKVNSKAGSTKLTYIGELFDA